MLRVVCDGIASAVLAIDRFDVVFLVLERDDLGGTDDGFNRQVWEWIISDIGGCRAVARVVYHCDQKRLVGSSTFSHEDSKTNGSAFHPVFWACNVTICTRNPLRLLISFPNNAFSIIPICVDSQIH